MTRENLVFGDNKGFMEIGKLKNPKYLRTVPGEQMPDLGLQAGCRPTKAHNDADALPESFLGGSALVKQRFEYRSYN